ncbi:MAG: S-layer homology domain-containing protein [Candidatus Margulisiibacteriota bacterium]
MKRITLAVLIGLFLIVSAYAEDVVFSDISANHWAKQYVYKIVELGVTKGYPDGTFRGNKTVTRYEAAVFLANLATALESKINDISVSSASGGQSAVSSRLLNELKAELNALEAEVAVLKAGAPGSSEGWVVKGELESVGILTNVASDATKAKKGYQSAALNLIKTLPDGTRIAIAYDTDYMQLDGDQDLVTDKAFSVVADYKTDIADMPMEFQFSTGPGYYSDIFGKAVIAPEDKIKVATKVSGFDVTGEYIEMSTATTLLKGEIKTVLPIDILGPTDIKVGAMDYFKGVNPLNDSKDIQLYAEFASLPSERVSIGGGVILGKMFETEQMALNAFVGLDDLWNTGTVIQGTFIKYGGNFFDLVTAGTLDEYAALKVNAFGSWVGINPASSTGFIGTDIAVSAKQTLSDELTLNGSLWMPYTGTLTKVIFTEIYVGLTYNLSTAVELTAGYDYTTYGEGATQACQDLNSYDYFNLGAKLTF